MNESQYYPNNCVYMQNGYRNRQDYLERMSEDYGVHINIVLALADLLGESEDFDGLLVALEDAQ